MLLFVYVSFHAQIQKVLSDGVQLWQRCFSSWGKVGSKYHYKRAIIGPQGKHHLNGVSLAYRWWPNIECWLRSFVVFQGIRTSIATKTYILMIFQRGGGVWTPPIPPLDLRMSSTNDSVVKTFPINTVLLEIARFLTRSSLETMCCALEQYTLSSLLSSDSTRKRHYTSKIVLTGV